MSIPQKNQMAKAGSASGDDELPMAWLAEMDSGDVDVALIMMTLAKLSRQVQDHYQNDLRTLRTNYSEYAALHSLVIAGPPYSMSPSRLNQNVGLSSGGITKTVDRLESDGLIERSPDPNDGRGVLVTLTDKGRRKADRIFGAGLVHYSRMLEHLSREERAQISASLKLLFNVFDGQQSDRLPHTVD